MILVSLLLCCLWAGNDYSASRGAELVQSHCRVVDSGDGLISCDIGGGQIASIAVDAFVTKARTYPRAGRLIVVYLVRSKEGPYALPVLYDWFRNGYYPYGRSNHH